MSINREHWFNLTLRVIGRLETASFALGQASAFRLLDITCAVESDFGTHLRQIGGGPGLGMFSIEPNTHQDIMGRWLHRKRRGLVTLRRNISLITGVGKREWESDLWRLHLMANLPYQIVVARLIYYSYPHPLPEYGDRDAMWDYYQKAFCRGCKTTRETFDAKWEKYLT